MIFANYFELYRDYQESLEEAQFRVMVRTEEERKIQKQRRQKLREQYVVDDEKLAITVGGRVKIKITQNQITKEKVDSIICPSFGQLDKRESTGFKIMKAGGVQVDEEV